VVALALALRCVLGGTVATSMAAVLTAAVAADLVDDFAGVTMISPLL
jgi:hypothetical protein